MYLTINIYVKYNCTHCFKEFELSVWQEHAFKKLGKTRLFCSYECKNEGHKTNEIVLVKCFKCNKEYSILKSRFDLKIKTGTKFFCTKECYDYYRKVILGKVILVCPVCGKYFNITKSRHEYMLKKGANNFYCSKKCGHVNLKTESSKLVEIKCDYCDIVIRRKKRYIKGDLCFCDRSCRAKYFAHLNKLGNRRSLLEVKVEEYIKKYYPYLYFIMNDREKLHGFELDFYIPQLRLGIEINGPAHFKPIYGDESLLRTQRNDIIKQKMCETKKIRLLIITDVINYNIDNSLDIFNNYIKPLLDELIVIEKIKPV